MHTGGREATILALAKQTGDTVWKGTTPQGDGAAYASPVIAEIGNIRQYVQLLSEGGASFAAADGKLLWRYGVAGNRFEGNTANIPTPIVRGNQVFFAAGYGRGGGLVQVTKRGNEFEARELWFKRELQNKHGGVIWLGDYLVWRQGRQRIAVVCRCSDRRDRVGEEEAERRQRFGGGDRSRRQSLLAVSERSGCARAGGRRQLRGNRQLQDPERPRPKLAAPGRDRRAARTCAIRTHFGVTICGRGSGRSYRAYPHSSKHRRQSWQIRWRSFGSSSVNLFFWYPAIESTYCCSLGAQLFKIGQIECVVDRPHDGDWVTLQFLESNLVVVACRNQRPLIEERVVHFAIPPQNVLVEIVGLGRLQLVQADIYQEGVFCRWKYRVGIAVDVNEFRLRKQFEKKADLGPYGVAI